MKAEIDTTIQTLVDTQLMEQGAFTPLELLLNSGRLAYADYENWRNGELEFLDEAFLGSPKRIRSLLDNAVAYAQSIQLSSEKQAFNAWNQQGNSLTLSSDDTLHQLLCQRFTSPQDSPQMDMFFDNPVVVLTNGITDALLKRSVTKAQNYLDQLYQQAPNHADLAIFDQMVALLARFDSKVEDPQAELLGLQALIPHAKRLLSSQSRDFLVPQWRRIDQALKNESFNPELAELHCSYVLAQAQDWLGVSTAILREPNYWQSEVLCLRLAECGYKRDDRAEALSAWCYLCWQFPETVDKILDGGQWGDMNVRRLWYAFWEVEEELDLEHGWATEEFPAWMLLAQPGLSGSLSGDLARNTSKGEQVYVAAHQLALVRLQGQDELLARKKMQELHLGLFEYWKRQV